VVPEETFNTATGIGSRHCVMGGPDGPRTTHCSTGPPKTFLEKKEILLKCFIFSIDIDA
jgi:hypothetical protein